MQVGRTSRGGSRSWGHPGVFVDAGEVDEGGEEEEEVEVGPDHGYGDAGDSHFEVDD